MRMKFIVMILVLLFTFQTSASAGFIGWAAANNAAREARSAKEKSEEAIRRIDDLERKLDRLIYLMEAKDVLN